jgi:hypothetical protein
VSGIEEQDKGAIEVALRAMRCCNGFSGPDADALWWRTDGEYAPVTMMVNCNDLFYWATADCEKITAANINGFEQAIADVVEAAGEDEVDAAPLLWVCRERQMRPQGAYYQHIDSRLHGLFNACGPARPSDSAPFGNPIASDAPAPETHHE